MVEVRGESGPAVLLLPGGAEAVDGFFPGLVEGLIAEPGCRVVLHDRPDGPVAGASADLHSMLADLGIGPVVAIGQSLGGAVAMLLARDHPEDVAGLVLLDPTPVNDPALAKQVDQRMRAVAAVYRVPLLGRAVPALMGATVNRHLRRATRPDVRAAWARMKLIDVPELARAADGIDTLAAGFRESDLPRVPTVVVTADRKPDSAIRRTHERLATALDAPLLSWPGADHNVQLTHPDEVLDVCRELVRSTRTRSEPPG